MLICDGQSTAKLNAGDRVIVRRSPDDVVLIENPDAREWRTLAENSAESLRKGTRVIATGRLRTERWETPEGHKRSRLVMDADGLGPDLAYATASVRKMARSNQGDPNDPWATASTTRPEVDAPAL